MFKLQLQNENAKKYHSSNNRLFRGINNGCRREKSLYFGTKVVCFKIPFNEILYFVFKWIENSFKMDAWGNVGRGKSTFKQILNYDFFMANFFLN